MRQAYTAICVLLLIVTSRILHVSLSTASSISSLYYYAVYDPVENSGILEITATISAEIPVYVEIPLGIFNEYAEFTLINYTYSGDLYVSGVNVSNSEAVVFLYGNGELKLVLFARNLVEETGVVAYLFTVNTDELRDITQSVNVTIIFIGIYSVEGAVVRLNWSTRSLDNATQIVLNGFGLGTLVLIPSVKEITEIPTPGPFEREFPWSVIVAAISLLAVVGFGAYFFKKKREELLVGRVDYLADSSYRAIIKALGDSGNKGLLQSEVVSKTGLSKSTVSRKLKRLEEEGFIVIKRSGKYNYVFLTDKGLEAYRRIIKEGAR